MQGGEHGHAGGAVGDQVAGQALIGAAGIVQIGEPGFGGEGVGIQPVQQRQIHAHAQHGILGGVEVHIGEGLHDQLVAVIPQWGVGVAVRQGVVDPGDDAVLQHQKAVFGDVHPAQCRGVDDVALQDLCHGTIPLFRQNKMSAPPPIAAKHP